MSEELKKKKRAMWLEASEQGKEVGGGRGSVSWDGGKIWGQMM